MRNVNVSMASPHYNSRRLRAGEVRPVLLPIGAVQERYGGVAVTTIERRIADPEIAMPPPVYIGRMRYWRLSELIEWEKSLPRELSAEGAAA